MSKGEKAKIVVTHRFEAAPERVFDAWLDPARAPKFLFSTPTGTMVKVEIDARVGGAFTFVDRRDGEDIAHVGEYVALDRPRHLAFDFAVPKFSSETTRVTVDIAAEGAGSVLTLTHEGVLPDYRERTQDGWRGILAKLEANGLHA